MGFHTSRSGGVRSEINVTPLVDIVMVLLIIFLVTMPVMMKTVTVEVPRRPTELELPPPQSIVVTYRSDQTFVVGDGAGNDSAPYPVVALAAEMLTRLRSGDGEKLVFVDFDDLVPWSDVVATMDRIRSISDQLASSPAGRAGNNLVKIALKTRDEG